MVRLVYVMFFGSCDVSLVGAAYARVAVDGAVVTIYKVREILPDVLGKQTK